ncbi:MAG: PepSY domain-containing protein [Candidatus Riflebacteria bacterium]|nr:PepSY domain-containing protein [Candidatus Riflebacteria bacterium]
MKRMWKLIVLTVTALVFGMVAIGQAAEPVTPKVKTEIPADLLKEAKISVEKAQEIAVKNASGTLESIELEKEKGALVFTFGIRDGKILNEVLVNAVDGKVVAVEKLDEKAQAEDKAKDEKEKGSGTSKEVGK